MLKAQGATEYLVLLAVVLIIALVSIALLGFFPGTASDARETESKQYWSGAASPMRILDARHICGTPCGAPGWPAYNLIIENTGAQTVTITGISYIVNPHGSAYGAGSAGPTSFCFNYNQTSEGAPITIGPGEKKRITSRESYSCLAPGTVALQGLNITYTVSIDGQSITKKQYGAKDFIIRCRGDCAGGPWDGCYGDC